MELVLSLLSLFISIKLKFCQNKSKSQVAFVDKESIEENDKVLDKEDSSKGDKRLAVNSRGKLVISCKRVTESTGTLMMNDEKVDKFGQEKEICISENITTEKEQKIKGK